jgi:DNA replication protein DnaC
MPPINKLYSLIIKSKIMNANATVQQLKDLKLSGMVRSYESVLQMPVQKQPEAHAMLAQLCDAESQYRVHYKTQFFLKLSKLRYAAMLEEISYTKERNLKPEQIAILADCSFIDRAENILISGATGSGKSFLACAFGHQACVMGYKTLYLNLNRFTEKLMTAKLDGTFVKLLNQLEKTSLLILDDFGLAPMDQNSRLGLLQILEDRYGKKSIIIASQLPIAKWHEAINEPTLADAIMDRLMANAHRFDLKGDSLRKKNQTEKK